MVTRPPGEPYHTYLIKIPRRLILFELIGKCEALDCKVGSDPMLDKEIRTVQSI
jgi:hypothetical protein